MTPQPHVRRLLSGVDITLGVGGATSYRRAWAAAVVADPRGDDGDLAPLIALGEELGGELGRAALRALDAPSAPVSYGKGAIVGAASRIEQGAALLHPRFGKPVRELLGQGKSIIPSTVKRGGPGCRLDVPLHGADDAWDFTQLDALEISVPDAPGPDEIVVVLVLGLGGRAFAQIGRDPLQDPHVRTANA